MLAQRLVRLNCPECAAAYDPPAALRAKSGAPENPRAFRQGKGCPACAGIGYRGRAAVGELLLMDDEMAELVLARRRTSELHERAVESGMCPIAQDGLERACTGQTTLEELSRVISPPEGQG